LFKINDFIKKPFWHKFWIVKGGDHMKIQRGEGGFTLIELAVVMAIIAIMALFVAPAVGEWFDNFRIRQAGREMSSDLQFAKMKAISMGRNCAIVFNQNGYAYVIFPDYDNDFELDPGNETNEIFKMASLKRNVVFDTTQGGGDGIDFPIVSGHPAVAFNPQGMPRDNAGSVPMPESNIFLKNTKNNKGRRITISTAGRISTNEY
jgi:prepilin-type N-terminal cleavage/methylation domain-containing protein